MRQVATERKPLVIVEDREALCEVSRKTSAREMEEMGVWVLLKKVLDSRSEGVGLAAIQIGYPLRAALLRLTGDDGITRDVGLINPRVVAQSSQTVRWEEGCLSFPGRFVNVYRPLAVVVEDDIHGRQRFNGFEAAVVMHELDHMDGFTMFDRQVKTIRRQGPNVGRNDPCPCGSGKKYKKCCGR